MPFARVTVAIAPLALILLSSVSIAQQPAPVPATPEGQAHRDEAMKIAGDTYATYAKRVCYGRDASLAAGATSLPATLVFDNLVFLGHDPLKWSAWALKTSAGIILFDTMDSDDEARNYIVEGLKAQGIDPMQIKRIVVMHGHGDHYGGAAYLHELTGAPVYMSTADWNFMAAQKSMQGASRKPARDKVLDDGDTLALGNTSVRFYLTPGHTPGTLSAIFPVFDHGQRHVVAYWGGTAIPSRDMAAIDQYLASVQRFRPIARAAKVDVFVSNHPTNDLTVSRLPMLAKRRGGQPNPFVIGADGYADTLGVLKECAEAAKADLAAFAAKRSD